jgi:PleD family two-component response regulator
MLQIEHKGNSHRFVTVSAGYCAFLPTDGADTASVLVKAADKALYAAKAGGRNQVRAGSYMAIAAPRSQSPRTAHTLF